MGDYRKDASGRIFDINQEGVLSLYPELANSQPVNQAGQVINQTGFVMPTAAQAPGLSNLALPGSTGSLGINSLIGSEASLASSTDLLQPQSGGLSATGTNFDYQGDFFGGTSANNLTPDAASSILNSGVGGLQFGGNDIADVAKFQGVTPESLLDLDSAGQAAVLNSFDSRPGQVFGGSKPMFTGGDMVNAGVGLGQLALGGLGFLEQKKINAAQIGELEKQRADIDAENKHTRKVRSGLGAAFGG